MTRSRDESPLPPAARRIFCNRTLNMRSICAVGFDMDYTLVHYRPEEWERQAYEHVRRRLLDRGWPVDDLQFDPELVSVGLILDLDLGNIVKANRFGYVRRACHGTRELPFEEYREIYSRVVVDLSEPRWVFMNTLFGMSEGCMYAQAVDLLDAGRIEGRINYADLYRMVRSSIDETHMEGALKAEILEQPERFVEPDPELPLAIMDLKHAGKKCLLITNSEWGYTRALMHHTFDRYLPGEMTWRELFDLVIVQARKPSFFTHDNAVFEVVDEDQGLVRPHVGRLREGAAYVGGSAALVERDLELSGEEILFVGDHIFADVHVSKNLLRWRTALVIRELEQELEALDAFAPKQAELTELMGRKERMEHRYSLLRIQVQRRDKGYGPQPERPAEEMRREMGELRKRMVALDERIAPLAREAGQLVNPRWGASMRAGNDKSHLARQIERYADVYTSRVSNFLHQTPFVYLRSTRGSLPHDP
ncbi:MAG: HAD-IG family 5'-nucleotidase [Myxococcota bacterium]